MKIFHRYNGSVIFKGSNIREALKARADLRFADLSFANLRTEIVNFIG